jgi:hypothetical protein
VLHLCLATGDSNKSGSNDNNGLLSTSQILGFADEVFDSKDAGGGQGGVSGQSGNKASLLEQLKQRMPWNQPQPASQQKQILTTVQHQQVKLSLSARKIISISSCTIIQRFCSSVSSEVHGGTSTQFVSLLSSDGQVERPRGGSSITQLFSHRPVLCAEELLILLINFMKKMKLEQAILPNPCLEEEEESL